MLQLLIVLVLVLCNGFFAMSEMAVMTSRKMRLTSPSNKGYDMARPTTPPASPSSAASSSTIATSLPNNA